MSTCRSVPILFNMEKLFFYFIEKVHFFSQIFVCVCRAGGIPDRVKKWDSKGDKKMFYRELW